MTRFIIKKVKDGEFVAHRPGERLVLAEISKTAQGFILSVHGERVGEYHAMLDDAKAAIQPALDQMRIIA